MDRMIKTLIDRLVRKGMEIETIPAYIRNLVHTISVDVILSPQELNRRLQLLGWDDFELDDHTLQLIIAIFETDGLNSPEPDKPFRFEATLNPDKIIKIYHAES